MENHKYGIDKMPWKPRQTVASDLKSLPNAPSYAELISFKELRAAVSAAGARELALLNKSAKKV
jgi:hypothetical protein